MATSERAKRFAYQALLLKVSNQLSSDNLRDLKHLLKDEFPTSSLDTAAQGTNLFTLLQQKGIMRERERERERERGNR